MPIIFSFKTRSGKIRHVVGTKTMDEICIDIVRSALRANGGRLLPPSIRNNDPPEPPRGNRKRKPESDSASNQLAVE